jgi:hypothetical protein
MKCHCAGMYSKIRPTSGNLVAEFGEDRPAHFLSLTSNVLMAFSKRALEKVVSPLLKKLATRVAGIFFRRVG